MKFSEPLKILAALATIILVTAGTLSATFSPNESVQEASPLYEIRNYHIAPQHFEAYHEWINTHGLPHIRKHMNVVGFWVDAAGVEGELRGVAMDELGSPNVTWVIKWESKEVRDETMAKTFSTPEWQEIFSRFAGGSDAYLRTEVNFFSGL